MKPIGGNVELTLKQTMSERIVTVSCDEDMTNAYDLMKSQTFRHLPVLDSLGQVVGIISDRDFKRAMWPTPNLESLDFVEGPIFRRNAKVYEYMSWPVKKLSHELDIRDAIAIMIAEKISAVVVVNNHQMVGIVTHEDLLRLLGALLKEPETFQSKLMSLLYNSPVGKMSDILSGIGI
jgi:acetoin utilization protein AcuB